MDDEEREHEPKEVCPTHGWTHTQQCWTQRRGMLDTRKGVADTWRKVDGHMERSRRRTHGGN